MILHTAFLSVSNILRPYDGDETFKKSRKKLSDACRAYGIEGWENIDKPGIAEAIGQGRWREYGQPAVFDYCEEDVRCSTKLLRAQLAGYRHYAPVDPQLVMRWSEYSAKTVAQIQARGMPIDMPLWNLVQENKMTIARALVARLDPSQGQGTIRSILRTVNGAPGHSSIGSALSASRLGPGWIPARCKSTAMRSV